MKNILRVLKNLFKEPVIYFFSGVLLSIGIKLLIADIVENHLWIFLSFTAIFIMYTVVTLEINRKKLSDQLDRFGYSVIWVSGAKEVYDRASAIISSAQDSILVVQPYIPEDQQANSPKERNDYFTAIEQKIEKHINDSCSNFTYKRLIQSDKADQIEGILTKAIFNEPQSFSHCKRILHMVKKKTACEVGFYVRKPMATFPSFYIVDDRHVSLLMFIVNQGSGEAHQSLKVIGGLFIEDRSGQFVSDFKHMYNNVINDPESHRFTLAQN